MKNRKILTTLLTAALTGAVSLTAFAGGWNAGTGADQNRWWYENDDGSYLADGWEWLDGNHEGVAECYYFDKDGWIYLSKTTPDGLAVNENGAWVTNGKIETKVVGTAPVAAVSNVNMSGKYLTGDYNASGTWVNKEEIETTYMRWISAKYQSGGDAMSAEEVAAWDAQFQKYNITDDLYKNTNPNRLTNANGFTYLVAAENATAVYDIAYSLGMKLFMNTDGMASFNATSVDNADGTVTITFTYELRG